MKGTYTDVNGTPYSDVDLERWAAESEEGYTGKHLGNPVVGRPVSVGRRAKPFTLRLDENRRARLEAVAAERHTTVSQLMRDLIDTL